MNTAIGSASQAMEIRSAESASQTISAATAATAQPPITKGALPGDDTRDFGAALGEEPK